MREVSSCMFLTIRELAARLVPPFPGRDLGWGSEWNSVELSKGAQSERAYRRFLGCSGDGFPGEEVPEDRIESERKNLRLAGIIFSNREPQEAIRIPEMVFETIMEVPGIAREFTPNLPPVPSETHPANSHIFSSGQSQDSLRMPPLDLCYLLRVTVPSEGCSDHYEEALVSVVNTPETPNMCGLVDSPGFPLSPPPGTLLRILQRPLLP